MGELANKNKEEKATESEEGSKEVQDTATESEEEEVTDTDDDIDWGDWDYVPDESCDPYYCPQSQPYFCIRGVSYTPPGWVRKYKKRTKSRSSSATSAAKKIKL